MLIQKATTTHHFVNQYQNSSERTRSSTLTNQQIDVTPIISNQTGKNNSPVPRNDARVV